MMLFDDIQKRMPYAESEDYLEQLIEKSTEQAILQAKKPKATVRMLRPLMSAAAVVVLLLAIGLTQFRSYEEPVAEVQVEQDLGPIDEFLNHLTDDEAQLLAYYEIEDFPEY